MTVLKLKVLHLWPGEKCRLAALISAGLFWSCLGASASLQAFVKSESGFDGAVTVAGQEVQNDIVVVTANVPYLDIHGKPKTGVARLIARTEDLQGKKPLPIFFHAEYEMKVKDAKKWCRQGWLVATAHYAQPAPSDPAIANGYNMARAIVQWLRRLPFADRTHLHVDGQSQGGYLALAIAADFFPVEAVTADAPIMNWDYTLSYWEANEKITKFPELNYKQSPLPFLWVVESTIDDNYRILGPDASSDTFYYLSPVSFLDRITCPALITCSTADVLVPMEQLTRSRLAGLKPELFPAGYVRDFNLLTKRKIARKVFEDRLPPEKVQWETVSPPKNTYELTMAIATGEQDRPTNRIDGADLPWSASRQWSICVLDEGYPVPQTGHRRFAWGCSSASFVRTHKDKPFGVSLLNQAKLDHLLQRYAGHLTPSLKLADGTSLNRLNYEAVEKRDVIVGLLDYAAMGKAYERNLVNLYSQSRQHPLGPRLTIAALLREKDSSDFK